MVLIMINLIKNFDFSAKEKFFYVLFFNHNGHKDFLTVEAEYAKIYNINHKVLKVLHYGH